MKGRWRVVAGLAALVVALGGCGVDGQRRAADIAEPDVPFDLLRRDATSPPSGAQDAPGTVAADIFLVGADGLHAVPRRLTEPIRLDALLDLLAAGPTAREADRGLSSALADESSVLGVELEGGIAHVDLGPPFVARPAGAQREALAQIVYTLTARPGIGRVSFTIDGDPAEVPRGDGTLTDESVSRDAYPASTSDGG